MKRKSLLLWALVCAVSLISSFAGPASGIAEALSRGTKVNPDVSVDVSISVPVPNLSLEETLFIGAAAAFFGMDVNIVANLYLPASSRTVTVEATTPHVAVSEPKALISAIYMSEYYDEDPLNIIGMRENGHGWDEISDRKAKGKKNKNKIKKGSDFETDSFVAFVTSYYDFPPAQVRKWLSLGMSETEIMFALNLAARAKVNPNAMINEWRKGESWEAIGAKYKISVDDLAKPVVPVKKFDNALP
ncbi:MAG: hypothetical protein GX872_01600 [Firmicutes bacterium]|nr:hypothetical protein [Bacillota bacterium]HXL03360.1 hypothetical protein [Bacillota bacterium]